MPLNFGRSLAGAGSGALAGAGFGPPGIAIGGGLGLLNSFFDPYGEAQKQSQQGFNEARGYEQPFITQGQEQYGALNQARQDLMDPAALQNKWAQGYETSPYAQQMLNMNRDQGLDAAGSMGLMGSSAALGNIQQGAGNIMQQDRQQYLQDLMQKYMSGIGLGQNMYGVGANMAGTLGGQAVHQGENMANLGYAQQAAPGQQLGQAAGMMADMYKPQPSFNFYGQGANPPANPSANSSMPYDWSKFFGTKGA